MRQRQQRQRVNVRGCAWPWGWRLASWADAGSNTELGGHPSCLVRPPHVKGTADATPPQAEALPVPPLSRVPKRYPRRVRSRRRWRPGTPKNCQRQGPPPTPHKADKSDWDGASYIIIIIVVRTGMAFSSLLDRVSGRYGKMSATGGAYTSRSLARSPTRHVTRQRQCLWQPSNRRSPCLAASLIVIIVVLLLIRLVVCGCVPCCKRFCSVVPL